MEGKARCRMWQTIAAMLLLCSLASCLIYFSLQGLSKVDRQDENIGDAEGLESMKGSILFNEKELNYQSDYAAVKENVLTQSDYKVVEDDMAEAAWRILNASLECGSNEFKLNAMGPGAADLQLEMDNKKPLPLIQAPKECGISVKQTTLGLVVTVPYNGCNIKHENGTYTLLMKWREDNIRIICTVLETPEIPATTESSQPPETTPSLMLQSPFRFKRHLRWLPMYYPCSPNKRFPLCLHTPSQQTTTTPEPTFPPLIHPYYMQKLLSLYPIYDAYENYVNMSPQKVMQRFAGKNLGWKLFHMHEKPQKPPHPFQHLFERLQQTITTAPPTTIKTTTPCTTTTTTASGGNGCSNFWNQLFHPHKFNPRGLIDGQDYQRFMGGDDYRAGYQNRDGSDSFWESFPLMPYNTR